MAGGSKIKDPYTTTLKSFLPLQMVCRMIRNVVQKTCTQIGIPDVNNFLVDVALKAPGIVLVPASAVGHTLKAGLGMCPVLRDLDLHGLPVVGPILVEIEAVGHAIDLINTATAPAAEARAAANDISALVTPAVPFLGAGAERGGISVPVIPKVPFTGAATTMPESFEPLRAMNPDATINIAQNAPEKLGGIVRKKPLTPLFGSF